MFRFRYQFKPADHARAAEAEAAGLAKIGKPRCPRPDPRSAPPPAMRPTAVARIKRMFRRHAVVRASSPVNTQPPVTSQAVFCKFAELAPLR